MQSNLYLSTVASSGLQKIVIYINKFKNFQAYVTLIFTVYLFSMNAVSIEYDVSTIVEIQ
jgi:hypothetical protein